MTYWQEAAGNPVLHQLGVADGNMEGKDVRFGIAASALFSVITTAASCGAVNAMHDSFTALGGMIPLFNMQLGEIVVGGVGAGIYGFLLFALLAVFIAGLMVGRTPEYVGKKIEAKEVSCGARHCRAASLHSGIHRIERRASARAGWSAQQGAARLYRDPLCFQFRHRQQRPEVCWTTAGTPFYNGLLSVAMWIGRFFMIVPVLAIAGSLSGEEVHACDGRLLPDDQAALDRPAGRHHPRRRWPHLSSQPRARSYRRPSGDGFRPDLLRENPMTTATSMFSGELVVPACRDAFRKLNPAKLVKNPVLFTTAIIALLLTVLLLIGAEPLPLGFQIS